MSEKKRGQKTDQADGVVRIAYPRGDLEAYIKAIERGQHEAVEELDRVNENRKGKRKLRLPIEVSFLDAAGNKEFTFSTSGSPPPEVYFERGLSTADLPNFAYVVATDGREKIVIRIEFEDAVVQ
ncbi:MAG: hypothetical protein LAN36_06560 [Acidobacteriia bacterium]|nr:hypothetical protein [Terriglobia bacterium]